MAEVNVPDLIEFEREVATAFEAGKIRAPVHLSGGNEEQLIEIFKDIKTEDWVFSTHRNHYHALLHGIPSGWLMTEILSGHSMSIHNREHRFVTSSIVAGCVPIAVGVAMGIRRGATEGHVWCFVGDMAAETGIFAEGAKYARSHRLPCTFIVEDNGMSTNTPTNQVWIHSDYRVTAAAPYIRYYRYKRTYPHINTGKWVVFA